MSAQGNSDGRLDIRKYPNRRYYDATRSTHVTLEQIHRLIQEGRDVRITDSKTEEDITTKVLAQIILEHDAPKLDIFPASLLHQIIRANQRVFPEFVDRYFNQALSAYFRSQEQVESHMRQSLGLGGGSLGADWAKTFYDTFAAPWFGKPADAERSAAELREEVAALRAELAALRERVPTDAGDD